MCIWCTYILIKFLLIIVQFVISELIILLFVGYLWNFNHQIQFYVTSTAGARCLVIPAYRFKNSVQIEQKFLLIVLLKFAYTDLYQKFSFMHQEFKRFKILVNNLGIWNKWIGQLFNFFFKKWLDTYITNLISG